MENGLTIAGILLALMGVGAVAAAQPAPSGVAPDPPVAVQKLRLAVTTDACVVERDGAASLVLDLKPPCHLLLWRQSPPKRTSDVSDGIPVGDVGQPMAWRYPGAEGVIAVAVIGDPITGALRNSNSFRLREQQKMQCAASVQGILFYGDRVQLSKKRADIGVLCVELGLNEKDFWILAHP